jgi:hypothetical protein
VKYDHYEDHYPLGNWIGNIRAKRIILDDEKIFYLNELGFIWAPIAELWESGYLKLKDFSDREGHCKVPKLHVENGFKLGAWVSEQRSNKDKLQSEKYVRLEKIGFIWNALTEKWEEGFQALVAYKNREGNCLVPDKFIENGFRLGQWVGIQRTNYSNISQDRKDRLNNLNFIWDILSVRWEIGFNALVKFKIREGHCLVPGKHFEGDVKLGQWVFVQRQSKQKISSNRMNRLDKIGFTWSVRKSTKT